jgi:transcriptional regulator with XRE-family HTH domain
VDVRQCLKISQEPFWNVTEFRLRCLGVPLKKSKGNKREVQLWLNQLGNEARSIRGKEKQDAFADRVGISRTTLSAIENGAYGYGVDALLKLLALKHANPAAEILQRESPPENERHAELHARLQELLDAGDNWPATAEANVDGVWLLYREKKKRKVS